MRPLTASDKIILTLLQLATWISAIAGIAGIVASLYHLLHADLWKTITFAPTAIVCLAQGVVFRYLRMRLTDELTRS